MLIGRLLARPHLLTDLVHGAEIGVIYQLHEVAVPELLIGGGVWVGGAWGSRVQSGGRVLGVCGGHDLEGDAEQGLGEAVLHGVALVQTHVTLQDAADQQPAISVEDTVVQTNLFSLALRSSLIGPGDLSLQRFGDTLQKRAAPVHSKQLPLRDAVLVVVS